MPSGCWLTTGEVGRWRYPVVLLGDAAHPMAPFLGQRCLRSVPSRW
ncbi:hypothetical protein SAMN05421810_106156 [Amycolatopsis arida]|uniref:FAD binding domain-containing protein n=1 Tax=Amycolatopsis arida TaxID=587909 RepID=A0A1I5XMS2_9PSEU|nr:hypothetical protein CLV69_102465 [Amycolatopsis arida]SFQ33106.1 hypothetical protein SAMN05421810_106156 [Amycolatopsis arida]